MGKGHVQTVKLKDLVEIQPGYQSKGQMTHDVDGNLPFIQVKDLDHDARSVKFEGIWKMKAPKDLTHYEISSQDLLYLSKGARAGAYRIDDPPAHTIALAHFFILRPNHKASISMRYLWWALNERHVAGHVQKAMKGTMMPFIGRAELAEIPIPLPTQEIQEQVAELASLRSQEKSLLMEIEAAKDRLIEGYMEKKVYGE